MFRALQEDWRMTKVDLIDQVAEKSELSKKEVEKLLETIITSIQTALKNGEKVSLTGLGTFVVKDKKARMARNPKTGEQVQVPAKKSPKFKPGKELKELIQ
ncbi:MAG: HU family DNA-binding protein [candidate division FCPU426 bacterium]